MGYIKEMIYEQRVKHQTKKMGNSIIKVETTDGVIERKFKDVTDEIIDAYLKVVKFKYNKSLETLENQVANLISQNNDFGFYFHNRFNYDAPGFYYLLFTSKKIILPIEMLLQLPLKYVIIYIGSKADVLPIEELEKMLFKCLDRDDFKGRNWQNGDRLGQIYRGIYKGLGGNEENKIEVPFEIRNLFLKLNYYLYSNDRGIHIGYIYGKDIGNSIYVKKIVDKAFEYKDFESLNFILNSRYIDKELKSEIVNKLKIEFPSNILDYEQLY